ncbi:MAG: Ppx/GppA phosphatase family protein [Nitrospirota bacterium]|nr:Ppx/GppA phosphatase family protein [Nitrospirota bacterium]
MKELKKVAVVDIGTNSVRLMIATASGKKIESVLYQDGRITRLGEGLADHGSISRQAIERTIPVLSEYSDRIRSYSPDRICFVGTSALRQAANQKDVLARFEEESGTRVRVISGEHEAALTYRGALLGLDEIKGPFLVIDIGGGSSELIVGETTRKFWKAFSVEVGVVTLTEGWFRSDPPSAGEVLQVRRYLEERFRDIVTILSPYLTSGVTPVGTAGSVTTILAMVRKMVRYDPVVVHGQGLSRQEVSKLFDEILLMKASERLALPGLEKGREDIILSGTLILLSILEFVNQAGLVVSSCGLREGVVLALADEGLDSVL